jgi:hypothetical protein
MISITVKFDNGNVTMIAGLQAELEVEGEAPTLRVGNGQQQMSMTLEEVKQVFIDGVMVFSDLEPKVKLQ